MLTGKRRGILVSVEPRQRQTLMLWDATTEKLITTLSTPKALGQQRRIYDVAATTTHIVCLASWSLIIWKLPSQFPNQTDIKPTVLHDFEPVQEFQNCCEDKQKTIR